MNESYIRWATTSEISRWHLKRSMSASADLIPTGLLMEGHWSVIRRFRSIKEVSTCRPATAGERSASAISRSPGSNKWGGELLGTGKFLHLCYRGAARTWALMRGSESMSVNNSVTWQGKGMVPEIPQSKTYWTGTWIKSTLPWRDPTSTSPHLHPVGMDSRGSHRPHANWLVETAIPSVLSMHEYAAYNTAAVHNPAKGAIATLSRVIGATRFESRCELAFAQRQSPCDVIL